ncbi:pentatricopeptide repeat-containing protein At5g40400-like [Salvia splendens]|uniref:pentatricopeptide repeat-containing protein At5g40400-like n=1 Tax=Salvia splendens TaxID=180675 RepID=UPI001C26DE53|nr:pentatricopeptide repeat-containing protein At5g40400-like [Salvia splendens]
MLMGSIRNFKHRNYSTSLSPLQSLSSHKPINNPLYNFLPQSNNPNNVVALVCSSLKENDHASLEHLKEQGLFSRFTSLELSRVLLRCQSDSSASLGFFNWVRNRLCLLPNAHTYCIMIHILVWSKNFKKAMKIMSELVQLNANVSDCERSNLYDSLLSSANDCNWDPVVFDMLIKAYLRYNMVTDAFHAFKKMVKRGFVPSIVATNCLLNGLSKMDCLGKCWEVHREMLRIQIRPNACTVNIFAHILCNEGHMDKVNEFLERMEEEGFDLDIVTYNILVDGYCKNRRLKDAIYLYNIMCTRGMVPDLITYTTLINGLCKGGSVREAHRFFSLMVQRGLRPDAVTYNTLIYGYCKEGMMQDVRAVLFDMIRNKVSPDDFTCWLLIKGYQNLDRMISAVNLVVELVRYGIMVSPDIYCYLILALCNDDRPFAAKSLLDQMSQNGYVPNAEVYNELICSLSRGKFVEEALELKIEMVSKGLKPKMSAYGAIIGGMCELRRSMEALSFMQEMIESGLPLDIKICRSLVYGLCKEKNIFEVESLLGFYAKEFQIFDAECYNAIVRVLSEAGVPSELIKLQDRMAKLGYAPNSLTCKCVIDGMWKAMKA